MKLSLMLYYTNMFMQGLLEAVRTMLPNGEHRQCARHVYANFAKKNGMVSNLDNCFGKLQSVHMLRSSTSYSRGLKTSMNKLTITWVIEDLPLGVGHFTGQGLIVMQ